MLKAQCSMLKAQSSKLKAQSSKLKAQCSKLNAQSSKLIPRFSFLNYWSNIFLFAIWKSRDPNRTPDCKKKTMSKDKNFSTRNFSNPSNGACDIPIYRDPFKCE